MDRVRFGRALGFGTRQAMKTLVNAVDAATAENPSATKTAPGQTSPPSTSSPSANATSFKSPTQTASAAISQDPATRKTAHSAARTAAQTSAQTRQLQKRLGRGGKRFGESVWEPFVRLSGVLWLEVTGSFFGLFALVALGYLWKLRASWHSNAPNAASRHSLIGAAIMFALFGYFSISSFLRARHRERKR